MIENKTKHVVGKVIWPGGRGGGGGGGGGAGSAATKLAFDPAHGPDISRGED